MTKLFGTFAVGLLVLSTTAQAQNSAGSSSGRMWGSTTNSGITPVDSSAMHAQDGNSAGQVNAAKLGLLFGPDVSITAIGSQNIVSTTVLGDNNSTNVTANQNSSNSGAVTTNGTITRTAQ